MAVNTGEAGQGVAAKPFGAYAIGPASLLRAIRRYSVIFAMFVVLAVVAGVSLWFFLPLPKMTGNMVYHISINPPSVLNPSPESRIHFSVYKNQQEALVKSRQVLSSVVADPEVANLPMLSRETTGADPVNFLADHILIGYPLGPEYMTVGIEGDDPSQLIPILKALSRAYIKYAVDKEKNARLEKLDQLKKLQDKYNEDMRANRTKIRKIMESIGSGDPFAIQVRERFLENQIGMTQSQLANVIAGLREKSVESSLVERTMTGQNGNLPDEIVSDLVKADPTYIALKEQQQQMALEIETISMSLQPGVKSPRLEQLERKKQELTDEMRGLPAKLKPEIISRYKDTMARMEREKLQGYREKMTMMNDLQKVLVKDIEELIAQRRDLSSNQFELETLKAEILQTEIMADKIAQEVEAIKPELDAPSRVSLWEEPVVTRGIAGKRREKYSGLAVGGVIVLGLALVQFLDIRNRRVQNADEITNNMGLAVLGALPKVPKPGVRNLDANWTQLLAEAVNTTRTLITCPRTVADQTMAVSPRRLLVTSATSGEGKTSLATHLSVSIANTNRKVLLIEADLRRPAAHAVFDVSLVPGLSEFLLNQTELSDIVKETTIPNLYMITAGIWNEMAPSGFTGERMRHAIAHLSQEYDYIVIDSPPILPVADSLSLAQYADGVLICVMQDYSRFAAVQAAYNRLVLVGAKVLGVVMARTKTDAGYYYYDRYYSQYRPANAYQPVSASS